MNCYYHTSAGTVAQCTDCGKGLCSECANKFNPVLCNECLLKRATYYRKELIKNTVLMIILFIVGFSFASSDSDMNFGQQLLIGYVFAGIPFGWSTLNKITPHIFLFLSWIGWIIYLSAKFTLSMMIGMFVTPFKIFHMIKEYKRIKEVADLAT